MKFDQKKNEIIIICFKHKEIKIVVKNIIDKAKFFNLPDYWDDKIEMLTRDDNEIMIKNVVKGTNEWNRLEANFKLTLAKA